MRIPWIVAVVTSMLVAGLGDRVPAARAQSDSADSVVTSPPDTSRAIVVQDSLGIPGTLKGDTVPPQDPAQTKQVLERMGSNEVEGGTEWERKKNPRTAMLCSALLPGLGQTYNGRRLKVGLMVGFTTFYFGSTWINWKRYEASIARRDTLEPGSAAFSYENQRAEFWKEEARTYMWWSGACWLIGILDSWIDAHLYDVREYTPPARPQALGLPESGVPVSYVTLEFDLDFSK